MAVKKGDSSKIIGVTPKLYIKDDGTTYISGEDYNGLWSTNSGTFADVVASSADGYANAGHWKFNEIEGNVAFNGRHRGTNDITFRNMIRGKDGIGTFVQYSLEDNTQLSAASPSYYAMLGSGGGYIETTGFIDWIKSNPVEDHVNLGVGNTFNGKIFFDCWCYFRKFNSASEEQTLLYLHNDASANAHDPVLSFSMDNVSGVPTLRLGYKNAANTALVYRDSTSAGLAIYPEGWEAEGGLHHVAFVFDRTQNFGAGQYGFYVDGNYYSGAGTFGIQTAILNVNTNAFLGCRIEGDNPTLTQVQGTDAPKFTNHFTGKFYMAQLSSDASLVTKSRMANLHGMRFDVPRGPAKVDFSDRFEADGPNVLQDIGTLKQQMETLKGSFTVTLSSIKVKN